MPMQLSGTQLLQFKKKSHLLTHVLLKVKNVFGVFSNFKKRPRISEKRHFCKIISYIQNKVNVDFIKKILFRKILLINI